MQSGLDGSKAFVVSHRVCRVCAQLKTIEEFRMSPGVKKDYRRFQCRECERLIQATIREERALDYEYVKARREAQKRYRCRNLDKMKAYQREYQRKYRAKKKAEANGQLVDS